MIVNALKRLLCFALIFSSVLILISCSNKKKDDDSDIEEIFSRLEIVDEDESGEDTEKTYFADHIYVVISNGCSGELSLKARELTDKIKEKVGILTSLKYDNELTVAPKNSCEVLIGNTNRLASENALDELKNNDYLCRWDDGSLVICGRSDKATLVAIDKFISDVLPTSSPYSLMHSDAHFELFNEYEIKKIILNGYDLSDYVFVYDSEQSIREREMAEALRDFINAKSGYLLDVVSDKEIKNDTRRTVKFSASKNNGDKAVIISEEKGLSFVGNDTYSLSMVVSEFAKSIKGGLANGTVDLKYGERTEIKDNETYFGAVYYFVKRGDGTSFKPIDDFLKFLQNSKFGVLFLGNPDSDIYEALPLNLKSHLKTVKISLDKREVLLVYDTNKVGKIDVSVDESAKKATAIVQTSFGETLRLVYAVSGSVEAVDPNSIVFAEKSGKISCKGANSVVDGMAETSVGKLEYCVLTEDNFSTKKENIEVNNLQDSFYCLITTELIYANSFLNDAFK